MQSAASCIARIFCLIILFDAVGGSALAGERIEVPIEVYPFVVIGLFLAGKGVQVIARSASTAAEARRRAQALERSERQAEQIRKQIGLSNWAPEKAAELLPENGEEKDVHVSVFAAPEVQPDDDFCAQVLLHLPHNVAQAEQLALKQDEDAAALANKSLTVPLVVGDLVRITMKCKGAEIADPVQSLVWNGEIAHRLFYLKVTATAQAEAAVKGTVFIYVNESPAGFVKFTVNVKSISTAQIPCPINENARRYSHAFLSYASEDRIKVLESTQLLKAVNIQFFQDLLNLDPGQRWEGRLYEEIDKCDIFIVYWSKYAAKSKWVIKEAEYALKREEELGQDLHFHPIILEVPVVKPDPPLSERHFSDPIRHIIFTEEYNQQMQAVRHILSGKISDVETSNPVSTSAINSAPDSRLR